MNCRDLENFIPFEDLKEQIAKKGRREENRRE